MSSEKNLTDAEWKKFSKGKKFEDRDWLKALDALESGAKSRDATAQLKALDDVEKQAGKLRAANKADKELTRYLDDAEKEIASQRKLLEAEAKKASQQAEQQESEDEEGPAALSTKMLPVLRAVPKGDVVMQALIAVAGKDVAVLVSRRAIGASMKKLLVEELGVSGGVKYMAGECIWEANAHTFVLEAKVANLAKLVKAALLKQTGGKFKVRVRGTDPHDVDEDGESGEEIESAEGEGEESPEKAQYQSRMAALKPQIDTALRDLIGDVPRIKALKAFAEAKAGEDNHKAALQALDSLAKLLPGAAAAQPAADDEAKHLTAELAKLAPMIQQAIAAHPERRQELLAAVAGFQAQLKDHQYPQAKDALMQIGRLLVALKNETSSASTSSSTTTTTSTSTKATKIPVQPLMPIWDAATADVMDQTTALIVSLRKYDDAELNRMAADLLETVNVLLAEVDDALEEYDRMTGEERAANADEALAFLRAQQREVASETLIKAADNNPLGVKSSIGDTMASALDEIAAAFEA